LLTTSDGNIHYSYTYNISDLKGNSIREYPEKVNKSVSSASAEANGINVIALPNGAHFLIITLTDLTSNHSVTQKKKFFINKPNREKSDKVIAAKIDGYEEYVNYTEEEINTEFNQIRYICRSEEIDIFKQLEDIESKKRFLSQFWARRDNDPATPVNEYKQLYFENLRVVNQNFSNQFKDGWRTDRGRVILIYGKPNEIERNPSTIDSQPYEIWYYYSLEGGSEFIFADLSGNGNYELLHSTFRNEIKDPDWQIRIQKLKSRNYDPGIDRF
jgi:GWxTD domain-containing protein